MKKRLFNFTAIISILACTVLTAAAVPVVRQGSGANAAGLQATVDQFRADLGGPNNGAGGSFTSGRRELNWDGVPDAFSEPNNFPVNFFNVNSPRGVIFNSIEDATGAALNQFAVSANAASGVPVRFANINATYDDFLQTFSAQRLFIARNTHMMEVLFFIPGTKIPATVSGFGVVFADVDSATGGDRSLIRVYGADGTQLAAASAPVLNNGLSFVGISFNTGERIARVVIESGNAAFSASNNDGVNGVDIVAMDDFIYGEPRAAQFHSGDFDGDGVTDTNIFRPSTGTWFTLHSGSNTVSQEQFGLNGDIPVDGDFDGDSRADLAVFRPSSGIWWFKRSSNGSTLGSQFGQNGDRPVVGDYDKDGKSDIALWRPSTGDHFILRSSSNFTTFFSYPFGVDGDIPVQAAAE
ncbi:MAG TPA: VCBS repeat-containing protein [Pyrinomonadaceae bacterium]